MEGLEYDRMYEVESHHWWFRSRASVVRFLLRRGLGTTVPDGASILDLGCGTGAFLDVLERDVLPGVGGAVGCDVSRDALAFCARRGLKKLVRSRGEALGLADGSFDAVVSLDCFEHIRSDLEAMQECQRILRPGGVLILQVPALGFLWSEHDEALHHLRRYSWRELDRKLRHAGFEIQYLSYSMFLLFPLAFFIRILQSFRKSSLKPRTLLWSPPGWLNRLLIRINDLERAMLAWCSLPIGLSLIAIARKNSTGGV